MWDGGAPRAAVKEESRLSECKKDGGGGGAPRAAVKESRLGECKNEGEGCTKSCGEGVRIR